MKTPEAIKKALACPVDRRGSLLPCSDCEYHGRGLPPCRMAAHEDALAYIRQLEEKVAKRDQLLAVMGVGMPKEGDP